VILHRGIGRDLPATIAITAVERKSFPLTRYEVKPKRSKNPPRAVNTTALLSERPTIHDDAHIWVSVSIGIILVISIVRASLPARYTVESKWITSTFKV
jgi:hypothetical protein